MERSYCDRSTKRAGVRRRGCERIEATTVDEEAGSKGVRYVPTNSWGEVASMVVDPHGRSDTKLAPHLLLAEDEAVLASLLEEYLTPAGFEVTVAADGMQALELLPGASFDLLLTDVRMPRMDGVRLVQQVRQTHPRMPVIVFSGYMTDDARATLGRLGVPHGAFLEKPTPFHILEDTIRAALSVTS